jgi:hypothetical protein
MSVTPYTRENMSQGQKLAYLQRLLENLPDSVPYCDAQSTGYCFSVSVDNIEEYGDENSATNHMLEVVFGPRHNTNGIVPITERGQGICAVFSILEKCSAANRGDACIQFWIDNLCSSAEKLYTEAGKKVRSSYQ